MKTQEKNYKQFDYQTILVKKEKLTKVIENYSCFGWSVLSKNQHPDYDNIMEIEFIRNHFVKNKDELQYLQVCYENDINKLGKFEKLKHSKSTMVGLSMGVLSALLVTFSITSFFVFQQWLNIILCVIIAILAAAIITLMPFLLKKIIKKENDTLKYRSEEIISIIKEYCIKAKILSGAQDER